MSTPIDTPLEDLNRDELVLLVEHLRDALEYEARAAEANYEGYKTYPKSRRPFAREQVRRLRALARGQWPDHYSQNAHRGFRNARTTREAPAPEPSE
jgi:hypothetical protein